MLYITQKNTPNSYLKSGLSQVITISVATLRRPSDYGSFGTKNTNDSRCVRLPAFERVVTSHGRS